MPMFLSYSGLRAPLFLSSIANSKNRRLAKPLSSTHAAASQAQLGAHAGMSGIRNEANVRKWRLSAKWPKVRCGWWKGDLGLRFERGRIAVPN